MGSIDVLFLGGFDGENVLMERIGKEEGGGG